MGHRPRGLMDDFRPRTLTVPRLPERPLPTGPSRHGRRTRGGQYDNAVSPTTNIPPPPPPPPAAGPRPDRMTQINAPSAPQPSFIGPPEDIHPDRLKQISGQVPPPPPPPPPPSGPSRLALAPLQTSDRLPSAPASHNSLPNTPGGQQAPTGPSSTNDRMRDRGERIMRGIQNTISGGSSRRGSGRGHIAGSDARS